MNISDMFRAEYTITQEDVRLSASCPIHIAEVTLASGEIAAHDHEFYEVALIRSGSATHRTSAARYPISAGSLLILRPGQVHAFEDIDQLELFNIYYLSEWLLRDPHLPIEAPALCLRFLGDALFPQRSYDAPLHCEIDHSYVQQTERDLAFIENLSKSETDTGLITRTTLLKCMALWNLSFPPAEAEHYLSSPLVQQVQQQIERTINNGDRSDVAGWATELGYSPDHLARSFKTQTGENPSTYYQRRRLQHAQLAVIHSTHSLSEIAHRYGFADSAHFSRDFRKQYHMSPKAYRARFTD
ncbi:MULTISPECIES: AraC family transcriptional regulator [unclassified Lentimonas]|uniref:AraC family transcriptional regulator n=2 Tax=Lentimonas TaxID=417293 RepID=UPI001389F0BE|nr:MULTISPECIES: AraC family transcriptional regulator [unclassified Lentimonas]